MKLHHAVSALIALSAATTLHAQNTPTDLTDPEVAHVAVTADNIDIAAGRFALTRSQNTEVKALANTMITDHTAVNAQPTALAGRLHVTPKDNAASRSPQSAAATAQRKPPRRRPAAFA